MEPAVSTADKGNRWRLVIVLPENPLPMSLCTVEGGAIAGEVVRMLTAAGVTLRSSILLERELIQ